MYYSVYNLQETKVLKFLYKIGIYCGKLIIWQIAIEKQKWVYSITSYNRQ